MQDNGSKRQGWRHGKDWQTYLIPWNIGGAVCGLLLGIVSLTLNRRQVAAALAHWRKRLLAQGQLPFSMIPASLSQRSEAAREPDLLPRYQQTEQGASHPSPMCGKP